VTGRAAKAPPEPADLYAGVRRRADRRRRARPGCRGGDGGDAVGDGA
jgi:hypothetical protein